MIDDKIDKTETYKVGSYAWFHFKNKGKEFKTPYGIKSKLSVFCDNYKNIDFLKRISDGKIKDCYPVNKDGWINGVLI